MLASIRNCCHSILRVECQVRQSAGHFTCMNEKGESVELNKLHTLYFQLSFFFILYTAAKGRTSEINSNLVYWSENEWNTGPSEECLDLVSRPIL